MMLHRTKCNSQSMKRRTDNCCIQLVGKITFRIQNVNGQCLNMIALDEIKANTQKNIK